MPFPDQLGERLLCIRSQGLAADFPGWWLTASLRLARAQEAEVALSCCGTVLNALQEKKDVLVAYRIDQATRDKLAEAVKSGQMTFFLVRDSDTRGLSDFIQVLDAGRTLIVTRQQLVQADVALTKDVADFSSALGGSWQEDTVDINAPGIATTLHAAAVGGASRLHRGRLGAWGENIVGRMARSLRRLSWVGGGWPPRTLPCAA
jgi:hypothetical protein